MGLLRNLANRVLAYIKWRQNLDLIILLLASLVCTILGAFGIASGSTLNSLILAILGFIAISQFKSREQVSNILTDWKHSRTAVFNKGFPEEYFKARNNSANSYFFAGMTMGRTFHGMRANMIRILDNGGSVRILLPDPSDSRLMRMISESRNRGVDDKQTAESIQQTIGLAKALPTANGQKAEVRTTTVLPRIGINAIELKHPSAMIMVQMYEFRPSTIDEESPIFILYRDDDLWFRRFEHEIERLWAAGTSV